MKQLAFTTFFILLPFLGMKAQQLAVDWSEPIPTSNEQHQLVGTMANTPYFIETTPNKWTLHAYTGVNSTPDRFELSVSKEEFVGATALQEKIVLFSTGTQDGEKVMKIRFFQEGNFREERQLFTVLHSGSKFIFTTSPNKEFIGILGEAPFIKGKNEELDVALMNADGQLVFREMVPFVHPNKKHKVNVPIVNNNGVLYLLKRVRDKSGSKYFAYSYTTKSGSVKTMKKTLNLRGKKIQDIEYALKPNGNLLLAGFYQANIPGVDEGSYFFELDESVRALQFNQKVFGTEFLLDAAGKKALKKDGGIRYYRTHQLVVSDGMVYLSATQSRWETGNQSKFLNEKLALICFTSEGEIRWEKVFPIEQISINDKGKWNIHRLLPAENGVLVAIQEHHTSKKDPIFNQLFITQKGELTRAKILDPGATSSTFMIDSKNVSLGDDGQIFLVRYKVDGSEFAIGQISYQ